MRRAAAVVATITSLCAALLVGAAGAGAKAAPHAAAAATGHLTAITPTRALASTAVAGRGYVTFAVPAAVPAAATSVVVNLTATGASGAGYLVAYADGAAQPGVSNVNYGAGRSVANLATVPIGSDGRIRIYNGGGGTVHALADVSGYFAPGVAGQGAFAQVGPTRVLDTRYGIGGAKAAVGAHKTVNLKIAGAASVPADAAAVVLNVTAASPTAAGFATAYPTGSTRPGSSNLNFVAGASAADLAVVPIGDSSSVSLYNGSSGTLQFVADVQGYLAYGDPTTAGALGALTANRIVDTGSSAEAEVPAHGSLAFSVTGRGGVPKTSVAALLATVTVVQPASSGYLTAYGGSSTTPPTASNVNFPSGRTVANSVLVAPAEGQVSVYNGSGHAVRVLVDVAGYALAANVPNVPPTTASHYTTNFSKLAAEGTADGTSGASLVLLDVGAQSITSPGLSASNPGVVLAHFPSRYAVTYPNLVAALTKYVTAFGAARTSSSKARIAVGTNSDGTFSGTNGYSADQRGKDWAADVIAPLQAAAPDNVTIAAANDIEAGFAATEAQAEQWETSFLANNTLALIYNGSADACPDTYDATTQCEPVASSTGTHAWTRANYVTLTHGLSPGRITVLPQIYFANDANQAAQWVNIDATSTDSLVFEGALAQRAVTGQLSEGFNGAGAWAALYHALSTRQDSPTLRVASELQPT